MTQGLLDLRAFGAHPLVFSELFFEGAVLFSVPAFEGLHALTPLSVQSLDVVRETRLLELCQEVPGLELLDFLVQSRDVIFGVLSLLLECIQVLFESPPPFIGQGLLLLEIFDPLREGGFVGQAFGVTGLEVANRLLEPFAIGCVLESLGFQFVDTVGKTRECQLRLNALCLPLLQESGYPGMFPLGICSLAFEALHLPGERLALLREAGALGVEVLKLLGEPLALVGCP